LTDRKSLIRELLLRFFQDELKTNEPLSGSDLLTFEVGVGYVNKVIDHDMSELKSGEVITILGLEQKLNGCVSIGQNGNRFEANLKGDADRVDRLTDGTIRAIDYKTGSFSKNFDIKSEEDFADPKTDIAFQLLTYLYLLSKQEKTANIEPLGYFLRASEIPRSVTVKLEKESIVEDALVEFAEEQIRVTIEALMNFSEPFSQTEDVKRCEFCEFNSVCQR
jgi:ATP-dependent helicase/DNAse subunit B